MATSSSLKCSVEYQGRSVSLAYDPSAFSFKDFDYYARRRFCIPERTIVLYSTADEKDVLPTASTLAKGKITLHTNDEWTPKGGAVTGAKVGGTGGLAPSTEDKKAASSLAVGGAQRSQAGSVIFGVQSSIDLAYYTQYFPYVLVALLAISLAPRSATNSRLRDVFEKLDDFAVWLGLPSSGISHTEWRTLFIEAYVTFVCRSFTELFIRRLCNPENDVRMVFQKFSIDAIFGAMAASIFVFLRKMSIANLK